MALAVMSPVFAQEKTSNHGKRFEQMERMLRDPMFTGLHQVSRKSILVTESLLYN
jgi:hypothetical protein